jgi:heptosyltransferase-2
MSRTPIRIGYDRDGRGSLLTHKIAPEGSESPVALLDYYARLARFALGIDHIDSRLELVPTSEQEAGADALLEGVRSPFVVINPGANRADKRWPAERFAQVGDRLAQSHGVSIVVSGSPAEADVLETVTRTMKHPATNLAMRGVRLGSLKAVIRRAALLITNDTGPRHIAAALNTPVVTLFGPTDHRWTTLNYPCERILLAEPFLPEELVADRHARACAIEKIAVGDVVAAANSLLQDPSSSAA